MSASTRFRLFSQCCSLLVLAACEPTPDFPAPEPPVAGKILAEASLVTRGDEGQLDLLYSEYTGQYRIHVRVPADAYPSGTRVTVRLVASLGPLEGARYTMNDVVGSTVGWFTAMQLLPAARVPATPVQVALSNVTQYSGSLDLLHAKEGDPGWHLVTALATMGDTVTFAADRPGLWTLVPTVMPPQLWTLLQRTGLACNSVAVANPAPVLLDLRNDTYVWTRVSADGCRTTQSGPIGRMGGSYCLGLSVQACVSAAASSVTLYWDSDRSDCAPQRYVTETYVPAPANAMDLLPPVSASCPSQDRGAPDAGRD